MSKVLGKVGYHQSKHTPGLWLHVSRDILFTLVVDAFGVKYTNKKHVLHLKAVIKKSYPVTTNWEGNQFIGVHLDWDYGRRELKASMPNYVKQALLQFQHETPDRVQCGPSKYTPPKFGPKGPQMMNIDTTEPLSKAEAKRLQQIGGKFLYYVRTIDDTMMHALNTLATQVTSGTQRTNQTIQHFLDYCSSNPEATKLYKASDMILKIHSDAAYLVEPGARSRAGGFFYLGINDDLIINGSILVLAKVIKNVVLSASEAKVVALFMNARLALPLRIALEELGHRQPTTEMITDNSTAEGILNGKMKQNRSKGMDMQYYWL